MPDTKPWVLITQNEGLMVDYVCSDDVDVFFIDYNESKENIDYREEKLSDAYRYSNSGRLPANVIDGVIEALEDQ